MKTLILSALTALAPQPPMSSGALSVQVETRSVVPSPHAAQAGLETRTAASDSAVEATATDPAPLLVYPMAGIYGRDYYIPYFVDLDPGTGAIRDFRCGNNTFDTHTGHDPYVRSFTEQDIGVPVFAAMDGVVESVHDGEPDRNTTDAGQPMNSIVLRHGNQKTLYQHLKRNSIRVSPGQTVTAGTQIAEVGSSGGSTGPHLHFEVQVDGQPYEPFAGPCRPGTSLLATQDQMLDSSVVLGVALSAQKFTDFRSIPYDEVPKTGTFLFGNAQRIYFNALIGNLPPESTYLIEVEKPNGARLEGRRGILTTQGVLLGDFSFTLEFDLNRVGEWNVLLTVNGERIATIPFTVVASMVEVVNRPPNEVTPSIEPVGLRAFSPAVCVASGPIVADPDFDAVRYRYEWRSNGSLVRGVTTAMRSDVLAREFVRGALTCSVTPFDGSLTGETGTAFAEPLGSSRRRAVRH